MAEIKVNTENSGGKTPNQTTNQPASETTNYTGRGQGAGSGQTRGVARRPAAQSLFSLTPRDFFSNSPFDLMRRFTDEMDRAFGAFGLSPSRMVAGTPLEGVMSAEQSGLTGQMSVWTPAIEIFEKGNDLIIYAELPGLNKDEVKVEVTDEGLIIQGERRQERQETRQGFRHSERSYGHFYRFVPLDESVNADEATAQFNNGVLELTIPMVQQQTRRRQIQIQEGRGQAQAGNQPSPDQQAKGISGGSQ